MHAENRTRFIYRLWQVPEYPNGNFVGPTIISNMTQSMEAYKNEIFGPVLCVLTVDTLEEAIELVNRSVSRKAFMLNCVCLF